MKSRTARTAFLVLLAAVFTIGLTFVTVELPYLIDDVLQGAITTPNLDSHANEVSRLKTELFISHFHLRLIGYICFTLMVAAIVVGFSTRNTGLAALGAFGFMLPVFAQFASVMFFLSGLGVLNILWLPVLDVSYDLQRLGLIIRAPYDVLRWAFGVVGVHGHWPVVYFFLGSGLLLFFLGTLAWLSARAREQQVADFWVYRLSRHPQYLGWILWSYGIYLLLLLQLYPKRSWGIDASLPWLLSTLVIIGVAMLEELLMRKRHGEAYETYRRSAPFLFPVPRFFEKTFAFPLRALFKKNEPDRVREVVAVIGLYGVLLIGASALYDAGLKRSLGAVIPSVRQAQLERLAARLIDEPHPRRKYSIAGELASYGAAAIDYFIPMLQSEQAAVRANAASQLARLPTERAVPALVAALEDSVDNVRGYALGALAASGSADCIEPVHRRLDDPERWVRMTALRTLAQLGAEEEVLGHADKLLRSPDAWEREAAVGSLGILGAPDAVPLLLERLHDEKDWVRRSAVAALLQIGSPDALGALQLASREDEDWEVRLYAAEASKQLARP
ncbi:MAG: HEAT repeat domain-containing protein [Gemmatimonadota bacterium]|nr:MAG: HEAT repeat domain-containing protein [Gemmatimonadota bacterium]